MKETEKKKITFDIKKENFSEWFSEIVSRAKLADIRYNVKGFVVFLPWSVRIMEKMYDILEKELQLKGHEPCFFPALIPEENLKIEAQHVEGFKPQVFWVTKAADKKIEKLALRPTSETAIYKMYSLWIRSYRDLPLKLYQRCQVWRYETKATKPFIRSREFYWIEAHDCFATKEEALEQVKQDIEITKKLLGILGIPFIPFRRPEWDKFPGALHTYGSDCLMPDGKMIQLPSTHFLGQNFSKTFGIKFKAKDKKEKFVWQTCYGPAVSRIIAALISVHGDSKGLVLPFSVSPIQVIIIPIFTKKNKERIIKKCEKIEKNLIEKNIQAKVDLTNFSPGEKFYFWEMKGVPLRLEIGKKELKTKRLTLFLRDKKEKINIKEKNLVKEIKKEGLNFDLRLKNRAEKEFNLKIINAKTIEEIKKILKEKKIARCNFCSINSDGEKCAEVIEKKLLATVRGIRADKHEIAKGKCIICGKKANYVVYISKSY